MPNGEDATIDTLPALWAGIRTFRLVVGGDESAIAGMIDACSGTLAQIARR